MKYPLRNPRNISVINPNPYTIMNLKSFLSASEDFLKFLISFAILVKPYFLDTMESVVILSYSALASFVFMRSRFSASFISLTLFCSEFSSNFESFERFDFKSLSCCLIIFILSFPSALLQKCVWIKTVSILPLISDIYLMPSNL